MGEIFKLKINIGNANVELEGEGSLVHTIFSELREFGLGKLSNCQPLEQVKAVQQCASNVNVEETRQDESEAPMQKECEVIALPNIRDIVMKNLPNTEAEWILVYALFTSENGAKTFTTEDLRQKYHDTNRYTESRGKNFASNFKRAVTSDWFTCINDNDYALSDAGKTVAYEIIQRSTDPSKQKPKKASQSHTKVNYQIVELGLDQAARNELKSYFESFEKLSNIEKSLVIAYWLNEHGSISEVNEHTIFSALKTMSQSTSFDIRASLKNGKNSNNYFTSGTNPGYYKIHHIGEDHVRELEAKRG